MGKWITVIGLAVLGACSGSTEPGPSESASDSTASQLVQLDRNAGGTVVNLTTNDRVDVKLSMVGPGNYGEPNLSSGAVKFDGMEYPTAVQNPGGPTQVYHFRAVSPGSSVITISSSGSGDPFSVTLHVE